MIQEIQIENYKSLHELKIEIGRFNVFAGDNGSGKSNLLEAFALFSAAASWKLDNEFLASRGIRVTEPRLMRSSFNGSTSQSKPIELGVKFRKFDIMQRYTLFNDNKPYSKWTSLGGNLSGLTKIWTVINALETGDNDISAQTAKKNILDSAAKYFGGSEDGARKYFNRPTNVLNCENKIKDFMIYSPENTTLRNFHKEGQIEPLGVNGEGLLKLLRTIRDQSDPKSKQTNLADAASPHQDTIEVSKLEEIHNSLRFFDWYVDLEIPGDLSESDDRIRIKDRYVSRTFDQRSANEGFLLVLFYIALMVSDDTPKVFAIDNIDASLNPELCAKLIKELIRLAEKYDKQVFVTTHNSAVLNTMDLDDEEQCLFTLFRNEQGHTQYHRITND